jgi:amidohydrolase
MATTTIRDDVDEILPGVIADRRHLHEHPELSFHEVETARFVAERLEALGVEDIRTNINTTGVTGIIRGRADGPDRCVLVRADMDALPIHEENDVEYRSTVDGVMHACGHDAHTSILLGLARLLVDRRDAFSGTVKVLFQPGEEVNPGGAKGMIEAGVLEDPRVDAVFGLHMSQGDPVGTISVGPGPQSAAVDDYEIIIRGKGGHAAEPNESVDPIVIGAQVVVALQTIVSRNVDPMDAAVLSICVFQSGEAFNVIPDTARLGGTIRFFNKDLREILTRRIEEVVSGVASAMGGSGEVIWDYGYPPLVNDPAMADLVREAATTIVGEGNVLAGVPKMGAEDFSYFLEHRPGAFFNVGSKNEDRGLVWGHHHPRFDIDEESLGTGLATMAQTVLTFLGGWSKEQGA